VIRVSTRVMETADTRLQLVRTGDVSNRFCGSMVAGSAVHVNGLRDLLPALSSKGKFSESTAGKPGLRLTVPVSFQRSIFALGLAILAATSAASIALDAKSRSDAAWVRHTLEALNRLTDTRLSFRRAESAARAYLLTSDQYFMDEYRQSVGRIEPAFAELKATVKDNVAQIQLLESSEPIVARRFALISEAVRLNAAGDTAGIAALTAKSEGPNRRIRSDRKAAPCHRTLLFGTDRFARSVTDEGGIALQTAASQSSARCGNRK
jgi:hypothetical protein